MCCCECIYKARSVCDLHWSDKSVIFKINYLQKSLQDLWTPIFLLGCMNTENTCWKNHRRDLLASVCMTRSKCWDPHNPWEQSVSHRKTGMLKNTQNSTYVEWKTNGDKIHNFVETTLFSSSTYAFLLVREMRKTQDLIWWVTSRTSWRYMDAAEEDCTVAQRSVSIGTLNAEHIEGVLRKGGCDHGPPKHPHAVPWTSIQNSFVVALLQRHPGNCSVSTNEKFECKV